MSTVFQQEVMQILGISEKEVSILTGAQEKAFYAIAFEKYEAQDYSSAALLFKQLVLTNPFAMDYWKGLASSEQMRQEYLAAVHAWSMVALLKEEDAIAHFHAAECLLAMNEKEDGLKALNAALKHCKDDAIKEKINALKRVHYDAC